MNRLVSFPLNTSSGSLRRQWFSNDEVKEETCTWLKKKKHKRLLNEASIHDFIQWWNTTSKEEKMMLRRMLNLFFFFILVYISIIIISIIKSVVIKMNRHYFLSGPHIFRQGYVQDIRYSEAKTPEPYILSITLPEYMRDSPKVTSVRNYNRFNNRSTQFMAK